MLDWARVVRLRLRSMFRSSSVDRELDRELAFHVEQRVAELMSEGYESYFQKGATRWARIVLRTAVPPATRLAPIGRAIASIDCSVAFQVQPITSAIAFAFIPSRLGALLVGTLGVLGATRASLVRLVVAEGLGVVGIGVIAGWAWQRSSPGRYAPFWQPNWAQIDPISYAVAAGHLCRRAPWRA
jgi:hypothetical protein